MYWTPAKMLLLTNVDEYSFANAAKVSKINYVYIGLHLTKGKE